MLTRELFRAWLFADRDSSVFDLPATRGGYMGLFRRAGLAAMASLVICTAAAADEPKAAADRHPFPKRQPAPEFKEGLRWFNTDKPLSLESLRGKFVVLDFWTYCCINCMHILPELAKLEQAYPNEVVVIGVHSAKFDGEKLDENIRDAILRHRIVHPVVNDADHGIWDAYAVSSWPSLRIIDPEGNFIAAESGEVEFEVLDQFLRGAIPHYRERGTLDATPPRFRPERLESSEMLRFPGKVLFDEATSRLFIADSGNDRILVAKVDPTAEGAIMATVGAVIGSGTTGRGDGSFESAGFNAPQGLALSDENTLWIADTENHLLRKADLARRTVETAAGTGVQARGPWPGTRFNPASRQLVANRKDGRYVDDPAKTAINSPWDLCVHANAIYIAMAGPHQIWRMPLDRTEIGPFAGNGREDIVDGKLLPKTPYQEGASSFAQPSGLSTDGTSLFVADSEGSSIRAVPLPDSKGMVRGGVRTLVGTASLQRARLFTFGDVDGEAGTARLQHPLGVAWHDGTVYVADTYNGKVKAVDAVKGTVRTVGGDAADALDEPAGISFGAGMLWIADTNNHRVVAMRPGDGVVRPVRIAMPGDRPGPAAEFVATTKEPAAVEAEVPHLERPATEPVRAQPVRVAPQIDAQGNRSITLTVAPEPPKGWKLNDLLPLKWELEASGDTGPVDAAALRRVTTVSKPKGPFTVTVPLSGGDGTTELLLIVETGICSLTEGECRPSSAAIRIPVAIADDGKPVGAVNLPLPRVAGAGGIPGLEFFR
jgi:sugar lactone lactonase YvrE